MPPTAPNAPESPLLETSLQLPLLRKGKVRDVYEIPAGLLTGALPAAAGGALLITASDRISAFDVVMPTPITGKGAVLTQLSTFWLRFIEARGLARTHLISTDHTLLPETIFSPGGTTREQLAGRIMIARKARVIPIECVARGYLEGSGWKEYQQSQSVCGVKLPSGLTQCAKLPMPIFTPATKEELGKHDENISFDRAASIAGENVMEQLRETTLAIYMAAAEHARSRGIIIADTKFEFGIPEGGTDPILIDEALTPDSSRFWPADDYAPGRAQKSFDKQYLREYLETLVAKNEWNKQAPGPQLPGEVVERTIAKYREAMQRLTA
ncbi:MAG: phosphoribosylaminoimidazolesuccinocarboxamide synthase [Planctomycetes bacterium]|nr:phosphoribosylaminoimidazolesuccinocarboxamide synthase [Planctomycetota bacterium]